MVNQEGQFYTMEGIAAAILMVITVYLVLGTTSVYTPGDTHIIDMQLEQLGSDALKILDTKESISSGSSDLEYYIHDNKAKEFVDNFTLLINPDQNEINPIHFRADVYYINKTGIVNWTRFAESSRKFSGNENAVTCSRWVFVAGSTIDLSEPLWGTTTTTDYNTKRNQTVLLEVLLWRG
jgi:hypothetical protein